MQLSAFLRVHRIATGTIILGAAATIWTGYRVLAERTTPVSEVNVGGEKSAVANAPLAIQACLKDQIGEETFQMLMTSARALTAAEEKLLNSCFRDILAPTDTQNQSVASPASTTATKTPATTAAGASPPSAASSSSTSQTPKSPTDDLHAEVWTKNGYDGASYEYKVNCGPNYATLQECFLWDLTHVSVTAPNGTVYELAKDFNVNAYSGEITRRWVLYGPGGGGLPSAGQYVWRYYQGEAIVHQHALEYSPQVVDPPSGITYSRDGDDLVIAWQAPAGISSAMWYKPSVDPPGNDRQIISKVMAWDQTSATLADVPVSAGEEIEINVAVFFPGGYAYPQPIKTTW